MQSYEKQCRIAERSIDKLKTQYIKRNIKNRVFANTRCVYVSIFAIRNSLNDNVSHEYDIVPDDINTGIKLVMKIGHCNETDVYTRNLQQMHKHNVIYIIPMMWIQSTHDAHPIDLERKIHRELPHITTKFLNKTGKGIYAPKELIPITYENFEYLNELVNERGITDEYFTDDNNDDKQLDIHKLIDEKTLTLLRRIDPEITLVTNCDGTGISL